MNDCPQARQPKAAEGLCPSCRYVRVVTNDRGSRFIFCERSRTDPRFPRYPRLPVLACSGYEPADATGGGSPGYDTSSDAPH
jgi:hypothetical protein